MSHAKRVVVTGVGTVNPLGLNSQVSWESLISGQSGIRKIDRFDVSALPCKIAGTIPDSFTPDPLIDVIEARRMDRFIQFAIHAGIQAVEDSGIGELPPEEKENIAVVIGSGIGGLPMIEKTAIDLHTAGPRRVSPYFIIASLINSPAGYISMYYKFRGPNESVVTACASGSHALCTAARMIRLSEAQVVLAGGAESAICPLGIAGFCAARALSTSFNDHPTTASRPWDKKRDGFVMGEGAGLLVLEEYEHAKARGAKIYAELKGFGSSGDAYHITAPHPEGQGAVLAMKRALKDAAIPLEDIGYINAHGTSTPIGDAIELKAVKSVFGSYAQQLAISSTKSSTGHLLGAAGSVEAIFSILALRDDILPPTLNLNEPDEGCDLNLVPLHSQNKNLKAVMSNSFGFGGTNVSMIFGKV